jgi:hypothetical protein
MSDFPGQPMQPGDCYTSEDPGNQTGRVWLTVRCQGPCPPFGPVFGRPAELVRRLLDEWVHVHRGCDAKVAMVSINTPVIPSSPRTEALPGSEAPRLSRGPETSDDA